MADEEPTRASRPRSPWVPSWISVVLALAGFAVVQWFFMRSEAPRRVPYSELLSLVREGKVARVEVDSTEVHAELKSPDEQADKAPRQRLVAGRLPQADDQLLVRELIDARVEFSGRIAQVPWWQTLLLSLVPVAFFVGLAIWANQRVNRLRGPLSVGKSRVKIFDQSRQNRATFADVAGVDEAKAEMEEVVDYLKHPGKYTALGARIPKGVLLVGAPGTGKTLLARAVAGEANVPFFTISGSEFVEMFVGVGAARVRDLFEQAKARAPCIVFIDELDAIGRTRGGVAAMSSHEEREQTLNQLLVEMDGFESGTGVVIMAATNRPEILDKALVRAGRFDRQVVVDRPDVDGREAILRVHARKAKLATQVDLRVVAQRTTGMVGADLANVVNEAALAAVRRGSTAVEQRDFEEAIDRIQLGLKKRGRAMSDDEKRRVAYHESGHTLVAMSVAHADPVHRVTIVPRSVGALGATLQLPTEDRYLVTKEELLDQLAVMQGGRAAEQLLSGDVSTGAQNDLERATETARQMVCRFGMSEKLGPQTFGRPVGLRYLDAPVALGDERNFSEATAQAIDQEVRSLLDGAYQRAKEVVEDRRLLLEELSRRLLVEETLDHDDLVALLGPTHPSGRVFGRSGGER